MRKLLTAAAFAAASLGVSAPASAQEYFIGQIIMGGWNFCPRGTASADGQLLQISQWSALFSLYGTMYGGDGRTTFGLPDLRGRIAMHTGQGPGLSQRTQGQKGGAEQVTITQNQMPPHSHSGSGTQSVTLTPGNNPNPSGNVPAITANSPAYAAPGGSTASFAAGL